ncbi:hypothetical protein HK101_009186 [Irineochytrium annulatum]|nr:hypothetical protein HK101_009186 [Irineochytrium annulatum]
MVSDYPPSPTISPGILEVMRAEVNSLRLRIADMEKEYEEGATAAREAYAKCRGEVVDLRGRLGMPGPSEDKMPISILPPLSVPGSPGELGEEEQG